MTDDPEDPFWWDNDDEQEYRAWVALFLRASSLRADADDDDRDDLLRVRRGVTVH